MTRLRRTLTVTVVAPALAVATGCGALRGPPAAPPEAAERLRAGAAALEAGDFTVAETDLRWAADRCASGRYGRDALLMLAVAHLDPRNPSRDASLAAEYSGQYLLLAGTPPELRTLARGVYLLALEHGGRPPGGESTGSADPAGEREEEAEAREPEGAESPAASRTTCGGEEGGGATLRDPESLPELPVASVPERIAEVEGEREALRVENASLMARLAELQRELARIRKLIKH